MLVQLQEAIRVFTTVAGQLLAQTYNSGVVNVPSVTSAGESLVFFKDNDYDSIKFTLPPQWLPYLQDADTRVWLTVRPNTNVANTKPTTPVLDVQGSVYDMEDLVCSVDLTAAQMNIKTGDYFWQLQLRKTINAVAQRRIALEGKLLVKPTFKE